MHHSLKNLGRSQEEEKKKKKAYPSNGMLCKEEKNEEKAILKDKSETSKRTKTHMRFFFLGYKGDAGT
jgi:hypothetical protein